jgi:hypothetical protein
MGDLFLGNDSLIDLFCSVCAGRSTSNENLGAPAGSSRTGLLAQLQDQHDEEHEGGDASTAGYVLLHISRSFLSYCLIPNSVHC